ncbi:hypothetical protein K2173_014244 [Erythroxylum novogranatense]|uniref:BZIP domain-containing protein n=1 Tax=Erythroxylum novogranatense TaxID=1862640 RepID=A0AAV8SE69_9ROSI|nr:hypothetical protein K2173_014244 [Erythroxylum novogranatense]
MGDVPTDWLDYLLKTTPSSDYGILSSKLIDLNSSLPTEEVDVSKSLPPKTQSSSIECNTDPIRGDNSQVEVVASLVNDKQDLGSLQQSNRHRRRRKRNYETPEETARIDKEKKIKNRVSAARSRAKRNEYINMLEEKTKQLRRANEFLKGQLKSQVLHEITMELTNKETKFPSFLQVEKMGKENGLQTKAETQTEKTMNRLRRTFSCPF